MKQFHFLRLVMPIAASLLLASPAQAAKKAPAPPVAPLTEAGEALLVEYTTRMESLKAELLKALPEIDEAKKSAYEKARAIELAAMTAHNATLKEQAEINNARDRAANAKDKWIPTQTGKILEAKEALKNANSAEQKTAAQTALTNAEVSVEKGKAELVKWSAELDVLLKKYPNHDETISKAEAALDKAKTITMAAVQNLGLADTLASDKIDAKLAAYQLMSHATPRVLASYAQEGKAQKKLIDDLFADGELLVEIAIADGATGAQYGKAMEIHQAILAASPKTGNSKTLAKLALAVALEHSTPIPQRNAAADTAAPIHVDAVKRYLAYEKAFLAGELDPCFDDLTTWELRMVIDGEEPDHIAAWGRQMLANYRPDQIRAEDERWRYVEIVRSDIRYGSQDNQFDQDDLQFYQNILKNGGICGRRAFMGRFILRCFGVPVAARPQPGHAALTHYTSDGWVVCLGATWGKGSTSTPYKSDLDFLATTQGRAAGEAYKQVARGYWIGNLVGEARAYGFLAPKDEIPLWNAVALYTQRDLIEKSAAKTLAAVGEDIGEANVTKEKVEIIKVTLSEKDKEVKIADNGTITIPAAATSQPTESNGKIIFMPSNRGGLQMHHSRNGDIAPFEYTFEAPKAGTYALTAAVCTPSWRQNLLISANGAQTVKLELPYTVGMWDTTAPVTVELKAGKNVLSFLHQPDGYAKGFSIHQFQLTPAK